MNNELLEKLNTLIVEINKLLPLANEYEKSKEKKRLPGFLAVHTRIEQFLQQEFGTESSYNIVNIELYVKYKISEF
jgi:hypothetical protein